MWKPQILSRTLVPHPPPYKEGAGLEYAQKLAERTQVLSLWLMFLGWSFVITAALLAISGSVLGAGPAPENAHWYEVLLAQKGLLFSTMAILTAATGWQLLDRSASATRLASVATHSIYLSTMPSTSQLKLDHAAYEACVQAKTAWLEGRMSTDRLENIAQRLGGIRQEELLNGASPNET